LQVKSITLYTYPTYPSKSEKGKGEKMQTPQYIVGMQGR